MAEPVFGADDRAQMVDVLGRYFWAVDTGDVDGIVAAFTVDGVVRYGTGQRYEGPAGLRAFALKAIGDASVRGRMHLNHPLYWRSENGLAVLRSYMVPVQISPMPANGPVRSLRYTEDSFARTEQGWRIRERAIYLWEHAPRSAQGGGT